MNPPDLILPHQMREELLKYLAKRPWEEVARIIPVMIQLNPVSAPEQRSEDETENVIKMPIKDPEQGE